MRHCTCECMKVLHSNQCLWFAQCVTQHCHTALYTSAVQCSTAVLSTATVLIQFLLGAGQWWNNLMNYVFRSYTRGLFSRPLEALVVAASSECSPILLLHALSSFIPINCALQLVQMWVKPCKSICSEPALSIHS